ncbi:MAG: Flp pilus assembly protein CpaB [Planctomycetota bacterium]|jgi:pilus assembly protein CpaB
MSTPRTELSMSRLLTLGLVMAALSAVLAYMAQSLLSEDGVPRSSGPIEVIVATRSLPPGHRLLQDDIKATAAPAGRRERSALTSVAASLGRTLVVPVESGQLLQEEHLAKPGSGASIAGQLPPGQRAITVSLRDSGPGVMLYPGAMVDILATVDVPSTLGRGTEAITRTLLQQVRVLAVNDEAVGGTGSEAAERRGGAASRRMTVTLAVTPEQATLVELAGARGTVGIVLRPSSEGDQGRSASLATSRELMGWTAQDLQAVEPATESGAAVQSSEDPSAPRLWAVTVIRGTEMERQQVPALTGGSAAKDRP